MFSIFMLVVVITLGILATIHAARWLATELAKDANMAAKDKIAAWEIFVKAATFYTTIIAGTFVGAKYLDQRQLELDAADRAAAQKVREFNLGIYSQSKSFEEYRRILLNEVTDLASSLATEEDLNSPMWKISYDRLERLYHGQLFIYEGYAVGSAMIDFRDALAKWKKLGKKPKELEAADRTNSKETLTLEKAHSDFMRQLALQLSAACKSEMLLSAQGLRAIHPYNLLFPSIYSQ